MDILYLLIPLSVVLVLLIIGVFAWAVNSGQFDDLEREGERILDGDGNKDANAKLSTDAARPANVDPNQGVD